MIQPPWKAERTTPFWHRDRGMGSARFPSADQSQAYGLFTTVNQRREQSPVESFPPGTARLQPGSSSSRSLSPQGLLPPEPAPTPARQTYSGLLETRADPS